MSSLGDLFYSGNSTEFGALRSERQGGHFSRNLGRSRIMPAGYNSPCKCVFNSMTHSSERATDLVVTSPKARCFCKLDMHITPPHTGWTEDTGTQIGMSALDTYVPNLPVFGVQESKSHERDELTFGEHDSAHSLHVLMRLDVDEAMKAIPFELEARMLRAQSTFGSSKLSVDPPPPPYPAGLSESSDSLYW